MEREVGGGIGMGNTCKSMANSCQCMTKPLQYCKVISLQLIKIKDKKEKKTIIKKITKSIRNIYEVCFKNRVFFFFKVIVGYKNEN